MQNTRQRILNYFKNNHQATAPELSLLLDLTQANIRHHLNVLEKDGYIEVIGKDKERRRGKPTNIFMLTKAAQDNAIDELASALLMEIQLEKASRLQHRKLKIIAENLAGKSSDAEKSITIQLSSAVQRLNELNYKARWEAHADAPQIIFSRCPYAQIINRHPELCRMDAEMLKHLTGEEFLQVEKISRTQDGPNHCRFI
ncbi:MAG: helix-turn-helix domain-containing protein, partial [Gammaproteobacteria bacterium]|nr:helix-turn-helix domain-containing protein [Gammaproteobacteria bacterium]